MIHYEGNFQVDIRGEARKDRLEDLCDLLKNWQMQMRTYVDLVENMLLSRASR